MSGNLSNRLHDLENYLLIRRRTQKEIAEHFVVDRKTVCRAIDKLSLSTNITEEKQGRNTIYFIPEENYNSPQFTPTELAALILSQEAILAGGTLSYGSPFASAGKSLIEKVRAKMPPRIKQNLAELSKIIGTAVVANKDYSQYGAIIEELFTAALEKRTALMHYDSLSSISSEQRLFDVYNIYLDPDGATLKTIGFDHKNNRISPFSLDRINSIKLTKEIFKRPPDFDLKGFLYENCFNGIHGEPIVTRLKMVGITANIFAESQFHPSQKIITVKKSNKKIEELEIEMRVAAWCGLERFILSWLPEIEVIAPDSLRSDIEKVIARSAENFLK